MASEANSRLAEIRKKFQATSTGFVPTPENQFGRIQKSKEEHVRAIKIAKARAARYNMTLRALAIKTNTDVTKIQRDDVAAKKEAAEKAAKYNMTSRALNVSRGMTAKDQENIAKALGDDVSPSIAKEVIKAVATKKHKDDIKATTHIRKKTIAAAKKKSLAPPPVQEEEEDDVGTVDSLQEEEPEVVEEKPMKKESVKPRERIEMTGMKDALKSGNEDDLNKFILTNFLESNAPHLLGQSDDLLSQYKEQLHVLFGSLLKKYPDGPDAEVSGQQKADKEITDAVDAGDVKISEKAPAKKVDADEDVDDDDSMIMDEAEIDAFDPKEKKPEPKAAAKAVKPEAVEEEDDDDSILEETDEKFNSGYGKTIKEAETGDGAIKSLARRRTTVKADADLTKELETYNHRDSFQSIASVDSLVEDATPAMVESGYIVAAELEEDEENKEEPSRWAVQFQNKNYALKQKLLKQGLSKDQVANLVDNLDNNTSEML